MNNVELKTIIVKLDLKLQCLRLIFYDYSDAYILVSAIITVPNTAAVRAAAKNRKTIIENCVPFTNSSSKINNTQIYNDKDIDIVMPMYHLIEYSDNYSKTSGSLWHCYRDEPFLADGAFADFPTSDNNSASFKFEKKNSRQNRK